MWLAFLATGTRCSISHSKDLGKPPKVAYFLWRALILFTFCNLSGMFLRPRYTYFNLDLFSRSFYPSSPLSSSSDSLLVRLSASGSCLQTPHNASLQAKAPYAQCMLHISSSFWLVLVVPATLPSPVDPGNLPAFGCLAVYTSWRTGEQVTEGVSFGLLIVTFSGKNDSGAALALLEA